MEGASEGMAGKPGIINANGMMGQPGFGFPPNQGNFNSMGWNGMNPMNGMTNMMPNGNWNNNMNPMGTFNYRQSCFFFACPLTTYADFNMMNNMNGMPNMANGMFNNFGGNMGIAGMNDMSAMSMMNYGGGYGNWGQGANGGGFNNFNGYNQMGGYNQTGAQYPEMMNQFPKNNFPNQNRFHANGVAFPNQRNNRNGSLGGHGNPNNGSGSGSGAGFNHNVNSRPGSRGGALPHNVRRFHKLPPVPPAIFPNTDVCVTQQRDGQSPDGNTEVAIETKVKDEHAQTSTEPAAEGKVDGEGAPDATTSPTAQAEGAPTGDLAEAPDALIQSAGDIPNSVPQTSGLNRIQTVDSIEMDHSAAYNDPMMTEAMHPDQAYGQGMINDYSNQMSHMNGAYNQNMGFNQNVHGSRGGFNTAYGAATVLVGEPLGEPKGMGVEGAPTGPRAMREGRPNTGFASRAPAHARSISNAPTPITNGPPATEAAPGSPPRRGRA